MKIDYLEKSASHKDIYEHLACCNVNFYPPLDKRSDILEYSKKIYEKAYTFEAWEGDRLVGLVAVYLNDGVRHFGYITNISVKKELWGKGIARKLLSKCLIQAKAKNFDKLSLEVFGNNYKAIGLYIKFGFRLSEISHDTIKMELNLKG